MCHRISIKQLKEDIGIETQEEWHIQLEEWMNDSMAPALCSEGCEVEPDGTCEHGFPSIFIAIGVI